MNRERTPDRDGLWKYSPRLFSPEGFSDGVPDNAFPAYGSVAAAFRIFCCMQAMKDLSAAFHVCFFPCLAGKP